MAPDRIAGINRVPATLADGREVVYYYHRATGTKLPGDFGSPEFLEALAGARAQAPGRDEGTLAGLLRAFQKTARWRDKLAESTKGEYVRIFKFWEEKFGAVPVRGLAGKAFRADVLEWHDEYSADHPREADNRVTVLARVLSWAAKDRELKANVLDGFERVYSSDRSDKIWLPEHVSAFMETAGPEMQIAMTLALHTGQRQGDILKMAWSNYDGRRLVIRQGKNRRGKPPRIVNIPCTKALRATLDALPRRGALIMPTKTGLAFKKRYFSDQWEEAETAAGLDELDLHFHDVRGTTVTLLFEGGCTVGEAAAITGHTLGTAQAILDKYLSRTAHLAESAIIKFENRMEQERAKDPAKGHTLDEAK